METLKAKVGPFPLWVWLALITALGLGYYLYEQHKNPSASSTANAPGTGQVPQIVDQTSQTSTTNVTVPPEGPEPKAPTDKDPEALAAADYRDLAIQALRDKGIKNPTPQQIADEQNDIRQTVGLGKAKGTPPKGGGTDKGVTPTTHHGQHRHQAPPKRHTPPVHVSPGFKPRPRPKLKRKAA